MKKKIAIALIGALCIIAVILVINRPKDISDVVKRNNQYQYGKQITTDYKVNNGESLKIGK